MTKETFKSFHLRLRVPEYNRIHGREYGRSPAATALGQKLRGYMLRQQPWSRMKRQLEWPAPLTPQSPPPSYNPPHRVPPTGEQTSKHISPLKPFPFTPPLHICRFQVSLLLWLTFFCHKYLLIFYFRQRTIIELWGNLKINQTWDDAELLTAEE